MVTCNLWLVTWGVGRRASASFVPESFWFGAVCPRAERRKEAEMRMRKRILWREILKGCKWMSDVPFAVAELSRMWHVNEIGGWGGVGEKSSELSLQRAAMIWSSGVVRSNKRKCCAAAPGNLSVIVSLNQRWPTSERRWSVMDPDRC